MIRAVIATLLGFFIPGFAWTLVLFKQISGIERVALSVGLSISLVTLSIIFTKMVFYLKINDLHSLFTNAFITVVPLVIRYTGKYLGKKKDRAAPNLS